MSRKTIPPEIEQRIRQMAGYRCGYCRSPQWLLPWELEIEHINPSARGGSDDEKNLWPSCRSCNSFKGAQTHARDPISNRRVKLFNPRNQQWIRHFKWNAGGTHIIGLTVSGRATVIALKLSNLFAVTARSAWVSAGWHPPNSEL